MTSTTTGLEGTMLTIAVQVLLVVLGVACAGLGWSAVDVVVRRRSGRPTSD